MLSVEERYKSRKKKGKAAVAPTPSRFALNREIVMEVANPWNLSPEVFTILWLKFLFGLLAQEIAGRLYPNSDIRAGGHHVGQLAKKGRMAILQDGSDSCAGYGELVATLSAAVRNLSNRDRGNQNKVGKYTPPRLCPRCRGSLIPEEDWYGAYLNCLSCGYIYEFDVDVSQDIVKDENKRGGRRRRPHHKIGDQKAPGHPILTCFLIQPAISSIAGFWLSIQSVNSTFSFWVAPNLILFRKRKYSEAAKAVRLFPSTKE